MVMTEIDNDKLLREFIVSGGFDLKMPKES